MNDERKYIFLSHATPEDNNFVRWLSAKLAALGYPVWVDLERLKGGDDNWGDIESAMRVRTVRCLAVVSNSSHGKAGVRKEWTLAATIENKVPGYLIPLRIDQFDYADLPIQLHSKHAIDFSPGWHLGLRDLLDTFESSGVSRALPGDSALARTIATSSGTDGYISLTQTQEVLDSNQVLIQSLPPSIETARITTAQRQIPLTTHNRTIPWFEHSEFIVGLAPARTLVEHFESEVRLSKHHGVDISEFLSGRAERLPVDRQEARFRVASLVRQSWDLKMESLGLKPHEMSARQLAWYVPSDLSPNNKFSFCDSDGKQRRRQLAGRSERYKVSWHYAVSAHPSLTRPFRIELRAHIVFCDASDGKVLSVKRMHRLRRSFCKGWWNDRWRGFIMAFLSHAASRGNSISLAVGGGRFIQVAATPVTFTAPVGLSDYSTPLLGDDEVIELESSSEEFGIDDLESAGSDSDEAEGSQ